MSTCNNYPTVLEYNRHVPCSPQYPITYLSNSELFKGVFRESSSTSGSQETSRTLSTCSQVFIKLLFYKNLLIHFNFMTKFWKPKQDFYFKSDKYNFNLLIRIHCTIHFSDTTHSNFYQSCPSFAAIYKLYI